LNNSGNTYLNLNKKGIFSVKELVESFQTAVGYITRMHGALIPEGKVIRVTVEFVDPAQAEPTVRLGTSPAQDPEHDKNELKRILAAMTKHRVRMQGAFRNYEVQALSTLQELSLESHLLKYRNVGKESLIDLGEAMERCGYACPWLKQLQEERAKSRVIPREIASSKARKLTTSEFAKIRRAFRGLQQTQRASMRVLSDLESSQNEPISIRQSLGRLADDNEWGQMVNTMNIRLRHGKLPFRILYTRESTPTRPFEGTLQFVVIPDHSSE
jgi:hypothetical protein